ncbi:MAG: isoprenylcysteine carboxylmethyltransferase family protein [Chloroflexi bacterium]|nr:isoprenylcysteine carboxylmethyltransferase family protein [Chloroflexota bacterium]
MSGVLQIWAALIIFAASHTVLASHGAKAIAARVVGARLAEVTYRLFFNVIALGAFAPALYLAWALPDTELYRFPAPVDTLALVIQALALAGLAYSVYQMDWAFFVGLRQLIGPSANTTLDSTSTAQLVTTGLHRYVRHPLYTTTLIMLYLVSPMTLNRLALVAGIHVYFWVGSIFEERKLVREFGGAYRDYQRRVPRLFPRLHA